MFVCLGFALLGLQSFALYLEVLLNWSSSRLSKQTDFPDNSRVFEAFLKT